MIADYPFLEKKYITINTPQGHSVVRPTVDPCESSIAVWLITIILTTEEEILLSITYLTTCIAKNQIFFSRYSVSLPIKLTKFIKLFQLPDGPTCKDTDTCDTQELSNLITNSVKQQIKAHGIDGVKKKHWNNNKNILFYPSNKCYHEVQAEEIRKIL